MHAQTDAIQIIAPILRRHLDPQKYTAFIFGSRAAQTASQRSDIDIGIQGVEAVPPEVYFAIEEDLENSDLPTVFDLVDFAKVSEKFKHLALQHTIPISLN